jgi:RHS repeat-associated protein
MPLSQRFTGKERDTETSLDYFGARYYGAGVERFMSADSGADQHPRDPQTWNLYSYVRNNSLLLVDPGGNYVCGSSMTDKQCDQFQNTLDQAQAAASKIADKYGAGSKQFQDAQRAIDAYGPRGQDNGVTINVGATAGYPGTTTASNNGRVTDENPTGQNIQVTLNSSLLTAALPMHRSGQSDTKGLTLRMPNNGRTTASHRPLIRPIWIPNFEHTALLSRSLKHLAQPS